MTGWFLAFGRTAAHHVVADGVGLCGIVPDQAPWLVHPHAGDIGLCETCRQAIADERPAPAKRGRR
ncbi:MAG: hypothetical protein NVS3B10_00350 [Polyangiales bacterium]